ncbi:MAG TPA: glycosyltransferase family 9 protein [Acetobacteraceae bacterium]|nr:glycosyltransferase family 9 protein [Acetobacteraceae bacterium]
MFEDLLPDYDIGLWIMQAIVIYRRTAAWHRLRASRRLCAALQKVADFRPRIELFLGRHPMMDNFLAQRAVYMNFTRATFLQGMTGIAAGGDMLDLAVDESILPSAGLRSGHYLTIHNGFDPAMLVAVLAGTMATKCYPRFAEVVRHIKAALPDLPLVQIGVAATSTAIEGVDQSLVGAATLPQTAALLKHAAWHIDNEGGLVHLARCFGTRCTVVFGPTPLDFFGYAANINIPPAACGGCWWITETWMARCPRGHLAPLCTQQDPRTIARATLDAMRRLPLPIAARQDVASA